MVGEDLWVEFDWLLRKLPHATVKDIQEIYKQEGYSAARDFLVEIAGETHE